MDTLFGQIARHWLVYIIDGIAFWLGGSGLVRGAVGKIIVAIAAGIFLGSFVLGPDLFFQKGQEAIRWMLNNVHFG